MNSCYIEVSHSTSAAHTPRPRRPFPPSTAWLTLLILTANCLTAADLPAPPPQYGPLAHEFNLTLTPGTRTEAFGPVFWTDQQPDSVRWGVAPLFSHASNPAIDSEEFDFLYPFITYDRFGEEYKLRLFLMTTFTGGSNQEPQPVRRFTLFPFIFLQRSPTPEFNYSAVFPLHGTIRDRLMRDEIEFTLFPLYSRTRKRDIETRNYLYPLVHTRTGDHLQGWQAWPLYGHETRQPFSHTNEFGDVDFVPGHNKTFALWPFWLQEDAGLGTTNPVHSRASLPFYFSVRSPARDSTTVLWPFFSHIVDREKNYREWQVPFPFIEFARGPGKTANRILPFYSHIATTNAESGSLLWPLWRYTRFEGSVYARERDRVLFFLYSDLRETNRLRNTVLHRRDLWPLFTWRQDHEGRERLQALALLEPFIPNNKGIERAWSPLWSLWRAEHNPATQQSSQSLLWNLYRHDHTPDRRKVSLLFGLFQYQSAPDGRQWRILYLPPLRKDHVPERR